MNRIWDRKLIRSIREQTVDEEPKEPPIALLVGLALTVAWIAAIVVYLYTHSNSVRELVPNAVGDFVAGAAAPLAFLWIVVAVFLQMQELNLQRRDIIASRKAQEQQAIETKALVEQNKNAVTVARAAHTEELSRQLELRLDRLLDTLAKQTKLRCKRVHIRSRQGDHRVLGHLEEIEDFDIIFDKANSALSHASNLIKDPGTTLVSGSDLVRELSALHNLATQIINNTNHDIHSLVAARSSSIEITHYEEMIRRILNWSSSKKMIQLRGLASSLI